MSLPALDVMAVLADLQQQLSDLTGVVETQQRTLQQLVEAGFADGSVGAAGARRPAAANATARTGHLAAEAPSAGLSVRGQAG